MTSYLPRPTWIDIDLDALIHNYNQAQSFCSAGQRLLAVVKADAYGHGAVPVCKTLAAQGVTDFAVATLEEALELRNHGIEGNLLVLGGCHSGQEQAFGELQLTAALLDIDMAKRLNIQALRSGRRQQVHLKVDSGMGRVGFQLDELRSQLSELKQLVGLDITGFMTHMACADELESSVTTDQQRRFSEMLALVRQAGIKPRDIHQSNSAGLSAWTCPECTLARPGIMLYGGLPGDAFKGRLELKPVMHLRSRIAQVRDLPAGSGVSYGHSFVTQRATRVAALPIGYADGYNRLLSNCGQGLLKGHRVPMIGRVCMDWILLDVTDVPGEVAIGDCVTLLGCSDGLTITGDDWAQQLGTIPYEVFCRMGSRVPRHY
jgi:alanine racemase